MNHKITINFTCSRKDTKPEQITLDWLELTDAFRKPSVNDNPIISKHVHSDSAVKKTNKDGPGWMPCSLKNPNGKRLSENIEQIFLLVLDVDSGVPLNKIEEVLKYYEFIIHSTYSHSTEIPKWRVILPLCNPIEPPKLAPLFDEVNKLFEGGLDVACGHDPARMYYLPSCPDETKSLFVFKHNEGIYLDPNATFVDPTTKPLKTSINSKGLGVKKNVSIGERNNTLTKLIGKQINEGSSIDEIEHLCQTWNSSNNLPLEDLEIKKTVGSIWKTHLRKNEAKEMDAEKVIFEMNEKYAWIEKYSSIYRFKFKDMTSQDDLRRKYANTWIEAPIKGSIKQVTYADAWIQSPMRRDYMDLAFTPGADLITDDCINLWRGWGAKSSLGDINPWNEMLDHIFGEHTGMRKWFEQWVAYPIKHPGAKLNTAVVLWSSIQGVGKSMIGETVGKIYGDHFKIITAQELHNNFNGWLKDCQFVLGEENASSDHRADSNKLKHLITGSTIYVEEKYQPRLKMVNRANFLFTSNHPDAFHIEDQDRRFFIWEIDSAKRADEFYAEFIEWRDHRNGLSALMHHLLTVDLTDFNPNASAPITESKKEMIYHSRTECEKWIHDVTNDNESIQEVFGSEITSITDMTKLFQQEHAASITTTAISKALKRKMPYILKKVTTKLGRKNLVSIANHDNWAKAHNSEWIKAYEKGQDRTDSLHYT